MRQLNVHKLVNNLNALCNDLQNKYNINCGGCCYVAYEIAKHLDRFHISYEMRVLNDCPISKKELSKGLEPISGCNTCCHYYLVIHGGGPVNRDSFGSWHHTYVVTGINHRNLNWLYRASSWNFVYRRRNNKLIKKIISLHFKQYGKVGKNNLCPCKSDSVFKMQVCG